MKRHVVLVIVGSVLGASIVSGYALTRPKPTPVYQLYVNHLDQLRIKSGLLRTAYQAHPYQWQAAYAFARICEEMEATANEVRTRGGDAPGNDWPEERNLSALAEQVVKLARTPQQKRDSRALLQRALSRHKDTQVL